MIVLTVVATTIAGCSDGSSHRARSAASTTPVVTTEPTSTVVTSTTTSTTATTTTTTTTTVPTPQPHYPSTYHGGAVIHDPEVQIVVWGPVYPASGLAAVQHLLGGLHDSSFGRVLTEYYDTTGHIHNDTRLIDTRTDHSTPPASVDPEQAGLAVGRAIAAARWQVKPNTVIVLLLPPGVKAEGCGYHSAAETQPLNQVPPAYAVIPYPDASCFPQWPDADALTLATSHEFAEAVTAPFNTGFPGPSGWWELGGTPLGQLADACQPAHSNLALTDGGTAVVADILSLREGHCIDFG
jgi:hypothetical protein